MSEKIKIPNDLFVVIIIALTTLIYITVPRLSITLARTWLELSMMLFFSGYALIAVLFPGKKYIGRIMRIILSFGFSYFIVIMLDLGLDYTPWGIRLMPIAITVITLVTCVIAIRRRSGFLEEETDLDHFTVIFQSKSYEPFKKPKLLIEFPTDLLFVIGFTIFTSIFILVPLLSASWLRSMLGLPMVLFFPGYALIAALFPKDDLEGIERLALSFGLSIAVVPLLGLCLNYSPWGIRLVPILVTLVVFTLAMCFIAAKRRSNLPDGEAFSVPFASLFQSLLNEIFLKSDSRVDRILTVILVISIISCVVMLAYVIFTPNQGEKFTEFYILGPGGVANDYPTEFVFGESGTVIVGIVNHEYKVVNYSLILKLNDEQLYGPKSIFLVHNNTWKQNVTFTPNKVGPYMKLQFLIYKEDNYTTPYRDLHLWVNVSEQKNEFV